MSKKKKIASICAAVPVLLILVLIVVIHTYDYNRLKPRIESAVQDSTGRELTMAGDIELDFGFSPALVVQEVALQNAEWGSEPDMVSCERFELQVALWPLITGDIRIKRLILVRPEVLLEKSAGGELNYRFKTGDKKKKDTGKEEKKEAEGGLPDLEVNQVRIKDAEMIYKDHASGSSYTVNLDRLSASADAMDAPLEFDLRGAFRQTPFSLSGEVSSLRELMQGQDTGFRLRMEVAGAQGSIEGNRIAKGGPNGFSAQVELSADSLKEINELAGTDLPENAAISLSTRISSRDMETILVRDLELGLAQSSLSGEAELDLGGDVPAVQASLSSEELDLRPFLPREDSSDSGGGKTSLRKGPQGRKRVFPDTPLSADFLRGMQAAVRVEIGKLLLPEARCENIRMDARLANGNLRVAPLRLNMAGGSLEGEIVLSDLRRSLAYDAKLRIAGMQVKRLLAMAGSRDFMQGEVEANLDLAARGESIAGLMGATDGEAAVILQQGEMDSAYFEELGGDTLATLGQYLDPEKKAQEETRINCFVSSFGIEQGVAESGIILADTERMRLLADGNVDLGTEKLDFSFDPSPKEGLDKGTLGEISLSLSELSKPFKLTGTLAEPSLTLDARDAALTLGKMAGGRVGAAADLLSGSERGEISCEKAISVARGEEQPEGKGGAEKESGGSPEENAVEKGVRDLKEGVEDLF